MLVNVNVIYYVHVCEQARWARSAGNSAIENLCIIIISRILTAILDIVTWWTSLKHISRILTAILDIVTWWTSLKHISRILTAILDIVTWWTSLRHHFVLFLIRSKQKQVQMNTYLMHVLKHLSVV